MWPKDITVSMTQSFPPGAQLLRLQATSHQSQASSRSEQQPDFPSNLFCNKAQEKEMKEGGLGEDEKAPGGQPLLVHSGDLMGDQGWRREHGPRVSP